MNSESMAQFKEILGERRQAWDEVERLKRWLEFIHDNSQPFEGAETLAGKALSGEEPPSE